MKITSSLLCCLLYLTSFKSFAQEQQEKFPEWHIGLFGGSFLEFIEPEQGKNYGNLFVLIAPHISFLTNRTIHSVQYDFVQQQVGIGNGLILGREFIFNIFYHQSIEDFKENVFSIGVEKVLKPKYLNFGHQHELVLFADVGVRREHFKKEKVSVIETKPFFSTGFILNFLALKR